MSLLGDMSTTKRELPRAKTLVHGQAGTGKGHPHGTPVLTPEGWVPVEKLSVGDYVIGSDGQPTEVFGVYERGSLRTFRVEINDGAWVEVDADHLWRVTNHKGSTFVTSTGEIVDNWDKSYSRKNLSIPRGEPAGGSVDPSIPPYLLGALLADGALSQSSVRWAKNDQAVIDGMQRELSGTSFTMEEKTYGDTRQWHPVNDDDRPGWSVLNRLLRTWGLDVTSGSKFIPGEVFGYSIANRLSVLAGLMDGDGSTPTYRGQAVYKTTSHRLAMDIQQLAWSLGHRATVSDQKTSDGTYRVGLLIEGEEGNPFRYSRHVEAWKPSKTQTERRIVNVRHGEVKPITCIAVAAPDCLYVTKDYIVTHNTSVAATVAELGRTLFLFPPKAEGIGSLDGVEHADNLVIQPIKSLPWMDEVFWELDAGDHDFDCVVVDEVSMLQEIVKRHVLRLGDNDPMPSSLPTAYNDYWGPIGNWFTDFFTYWYGLASPDKKRPMHVVMTTHTKAQDDVEGNQLLQPDLHKGPLNMALKVPDQILYTFVGSDEEDLNDLEMRYMVRVKPSHTIKAKTRCSPERAAALPAVLGVNNRFTLPNYLRVTGGVSGLGTDNKSS